MNFPLKKRFFSYNDCLNYALYLVRDFDLSYIKKAVILICDTSTEEFWLYFFDKNISFSLYKSIKRKINEHFFHSVPIPYLNNKIFFFNRFFFIENGIFIPQSETELLINEIIFFSEKFFSPKEIKQIKALEIGTGCGAISIILSTINQNWIIDAIDINEKAIKASKKNFCSENKKGNLKFLCKDFLDFYPDEKFDLIFANPPYLNLQEYDNLPLMVKKQPFESLVYSLTDELSFYRIIFDRIKFIAKNKFLLIMEISPLVKKGIEKFFSTNLFFIKLIKDHNNSERIIVVSSK